MERISAQTASREVSHENVDPLFQRRIRLLPRPSILWLCVSTFLALSVYSLLLYARRPTFNQAIDFIILKLSGVPLSSRIQCDKVQVCGGVVDTSWQSRIEKRTSPCSIDVVQSIQVTKAQNAICFWTHDVIAGRLWTHVVYQREYRFRLDFRNIAREAIRVEQAVPEGSHCTFVPSDLLRTAYLSESVYSVHLTFTKGIPVSVHLKALGSGDGEEASEARETTETWNEGRFAAGSEGLAQRVAQGFNRATKLCGAKEEVF